MKILVVEDDPKLGSFLRKGLEAEGFSVDFCADGDEGHTLATTRAYDALVLDIMLPGRDGLSILRNLRERQAAVPVLLLTARSSLPERLDGFNLGADDYLTKPFYLDELAARLRALLRRSGEQPAHRMQCRDVVVDLVTREVRRDDRVVELTAREFSLLTCLMRTPGRTFSRPQLCEHVWNYHFDPGTNLVDVYVQRLRRKLGHDADHPFIETVRGVGYRLPPAGRAP